MMNKTTNLFHYTKSLENLKSILLNGFYPFYRIEKFLGHEQPMKQQFEVAGLPDNFSIDEIAIPMVSFCDIRLSQIKDHVNNYGFYGIGLHDDWKVNNEVSPIIYLDTRNSSLKYIINSLYLSIIQQNAKLLNENIPINKFDFNFCLFNFNRYCYIIITIG